LQLDREGESVRQQAKASPALPVVSGGSRTLDIIPWDLTQARHVDESAAFATMLAGDLGTRVHMGPSPVRRAPLRVLEGINMPAVLVEMAFLTNPDQEKLATSDNYKSTVAQAIVDAIGRFRRHLEEPRTR
jgi:N-acetylmuramoyl-L-alanine amidase